MTRPSPDQDRRIAALEANQRRLEAALIDLLDRVRHLEAEAERRTFAASIHSLMRAGVKG